MDLKKKMHQGHVSVYIKNVRLFSLTSIGISGGNNEFQTTEAYSDFDLTKVKYRTYQHSREENL
jgi:hypothetical protein